MDRILLLGVEDAKLVGFLEKMGHELCVPKKGFALPGIIESQILDLIILDTRQELEPVEVCQFLRDQDKTRDVPILLLSDHRVHALKLKEEGISGIENIEIPYSIGLLASKIATLLRLRKMAGANDENASLAEVNAALRDLNDHFQKELVEARKIQEGLLPDGLPRDARYELAASYEPLEEVGGDWYYARKVAGEKLSVQIGDVTGHGLSAAFIGSMTKLALFAAERDLPHELLEKMNSLMAPQIPEGKFVTMFSYLYEPENGELHYARAGHLPGFLLRRASGTVEQLMGDGFAVGFFEEAEYTAQSTIMEVGDILVVLTDAIPETQNMAGDAYGFERLSQALTKSPVDGGVVGALTAILEDFEAFRDGRLLKDDVTLVALRRVE